MMKSAYTDPFDKQYNCPKTLEALSKAICDILPRLDQLENRLHKLETGEDVE